MTGIYVLFILAVIMVIAAVWMYSNAETNSFEKVLTAVNATKGDAKGAVDQCEDLSAKIKGLENEIGNLVALLTTQNDALDGITKDYKKLKEELTILTVRQHRTERTVNVKFSSPIPVEMVERPKPPPVPKPVGKGKESLLKRSGVSKDAQ